MPIAVKLLLKEVIYCCTHSSDCSLQNKETGQWANNEWKKCKAENNKMEEQANDVLHQIDTSSPFIFCCILQSLEYN